MRAAALALFVLLTACAGGPRAPEAAVALAPLLGCWRGTFDAGPEGIVDERCFHVLSERHVVDTHAVRPTDYAGETTYHLDDANGRIIFAYAANDGGRSHGSVEVGEGRFVFPPHEYRAPDGAVQRLRSIWTFEGPDRFVAVSEREEGGAWRPLMRITYVRVSR